MKLALDLETSGLDPEKHEILEIGLLGYGEDEGIFFNVRIKAEKPVDPGAIRINGLDPTDGVSKAEALMKLATFLYDKKIDALTHGGNFDFAFLKATFGHDFINRHFNYHYNDTQKLCQVLRDAGIVKSCSLQNMLKYYGIDGGVAHTALGDCESTIKLYHKILGEFGFELFNGNVYKCIEPCASCKGECNHE